MAALSPCATAVAVACDCSEPRSSEAEVFTCQLCSAQLFALPGNAGSALSVLKRVIKRVQGVCMWSWDGLSLPDLARGSWCRSPRVTPGRENEERGVQAEQINRGILSASSWRLAMGTKPVLLASGHSQCRSKGGAKKSTQLVGKEAPRA